MTSQKKGARLWFETQEEIDAYDDLMMSNMELKSDNFDDQNFTIASLRPRKERMPSISRKIKEQLAKFEAFILGRNQNRSGEHGRFNTVSLLTDKEYYIRMAYFGFPVTYLLIRELPFRNFYFRTFIMLLFFDSYCRQYGMPNPITGQYGHWQLVTEHSEARKEKYIFDWIRDVHTNRPMNLDGEGNFSSFFYSKEVSFYFKYMISSKYFAYRMI